MSILTVAEKKGVRSGQINKLWQRTYTRVFQVTTSTAHDGPVAVMSAVDPVTHVAVPGVGNTYTNGDALFTQTEFDEGAFVESLEPREVSEDGKQWDVTVNYGPYDSRLFGKDPTQWPMRIAFTGQNFERVVYIDQDGVAILNSAGEPFSEPVTVDDRRSIITVSRNELISSFDLTLAEAFSNSINTGAWNGFDAFTVKCGSITTSENQYDSNAQVWYFTVTYPFEVNRDKWTRQLLDQGYQQLDSSSPPKLVAIRTDQGQPCTEAQLLDGSGKKLLHGADPVFLDFPVYKETNFSGLNIDFSSLMGRF